MKVNRRGCRETVDVTADGEGFCSHAGALLLVNLADRLGLTKGSQKRCRALVSAVPLTMMEILRDLIVTSVAGGQHLSDLAALRDQPDLFGNVASDSTAFRLISGSGRPSWRACASLARRHASVRLRSVLARRS